LCRIYGEFGSVSLMVSCGVIHKPRVIFVDIREVS
jgi:hypothetical protein